MEQFCRTEMILGKENIEKIHKANVIVFGLGGVGSFVCEALVRTGVENITIVDNDTINLSNLNRQLIALNSTIGKDKVEVMKERILDINPNVKVDAQKVFVTPDNVSTLIDKSFDYIIDAIDTVSAKISIIETAKKLDIPVISCMGTGNKLHPEKFEIVDISKTSVCPLAKIVRKELKERNIKKVKVLYSKEEPIKHFDDIDIGLEGTRKKVPGSISFVPSVAGLMIAGEIIRDLIS